MIPETPGAPQVPETPDSHQNAEMAAAIREVRSEIVRSLSNGMAELAAALKPGTSVRDLPSDSLNVWTSAAQPGSTQLLVPAQETRTRVLLFAATNGVWISSQPGQRVTATGTANTAKLPAGVLLEINTRAAIYAATDTGADVPVSVFVEYATYSL